MGNPSLGQRWRRNRASSCQVGGHGHDLSLLNTRLWPRIIRKRRMALVMRSRRDKACGSGSRGCSRRRGHHCVFGWLRRTGSNRGLGLRRNCNSSSRGSRRLVGLLWPLFLIRIGGPSARIHAGVGWRGRAGGHALEILFQNADLDRRAALILRWRLLRKRAGDWLLRLRGRDRVHALVYRRGTRGCLVGRLCRCPGTLRLRCLIIVLRQSLCGGSTLHLRSLQTRESSRA